MSAVYLFWYKCECRVTTSSFRSFRCFQLGQRIECPFLLVTRQVGGVGLGLLASDQRPSGSEPLQAIEHPYKAPQLYFFPHLSHNSLHQGQGASLALHAYHFPQVLGKPMVEASCSNPVLWVCLEQGKNSSNTHCFSRIARAQQHTFGHWSRPHEANNTITNSDCIERSSF